MWDSPQNEDDVPPNPRTDVTGTDLSAPTTSRKTDVFDVASLPADRPVVSPASSPSPAAPVASRPMAPPTVSQSAAPARPAPFSSIGSVPIVPPAPAPAAPPISSGPAPLVPAAGAMAAARPTAPPTSPTTTEAQPRRRRWPLLLLALLTIAASGALSWGVATWVDRSNDTVSVPTAATDSATDDAEASPNAQPAVQGNETPSPAVTNQSTSARALADEPFAVAAEIIRPSVVQLNLGNGLGTGVIINEDGTILTAAHVVGNNTDVLVTFFDGSSAEGTVVGTHVPTDVAVVQVDPSGRDLVAAAIAEGDDVRVGQIAIAVGSPFGFDQTVTAGIISAVDRIVRTDASSAGVSMVQTDAPINPGNSGGPLINLDGEVVGINDLIFTESGSSAGVGFAISIDLAVIIAEQLLEGVEPQFALLGVSTSPAPNGDRGAQVQDIEPGSAAANAGLEVGDVIIALNDVNTRGTSELRAQILDQAPGSNVDITVLRDGQQQELTATLGRSG